MYMNISELLTKTQTLFWCPESTLKINKSEWNIALPNSCKTFFMKHMIPYGWTFMRFCAKFKQFRTFIE